MSKNSLPLLVGAAAVVTLFSGEPTQAQELPRGGTVLERPRPELAPLGIRAGSFFIFPRIELGLNYEDNVFTTENDKESDFITLAFPRVDVRSNFARHAINLTTSAEIARYAEFPGENYEDYAILANGRLDIARDSTATAEARHIRDHEVRSDPDSPLGREKAVKYTIDVGGVAFEQRFNRVSARLGLILRHTDYQDVTLQDGGTVDQDFRNRYEYESSLRLGYRFQPAYEAFVRGTVDKIDRNEFPAGRVSRDSTGYEFVVGTALDLTGLLTGEAYIGYLERDYQDESLTDVSGLAFGGQIDWAATQLTTVRFNADRRVRELGGLMDSTEASGYVRSILGVRVDHELLRSLILGASAQFQWDEYEGIDRTDHYYTLGAGGTYTLNRNLYLRLSYTFDKRNSTLTNFDYTDNIIGLRLGAQL